MLFRQLDRRSARRLRIQKSDYGSRRQGSYFPWVFYDDSLSPQSSHLGSDIIHPERDVKQSFAPLLQELPHAMLKVSWLDQLDKISPDRNHEGFASRHFHHTVGVRLESQYPGIQIDALTDISNDVADVSTVLNQPRFSPSQQNSRSCDRRFADGGIRIEKNAFFFCVLNPAASIVSS
jgi:hypothetical protein